MKVCGRCAHEKKPGARPGKWNVECESQRCWPPCCRLVLPAAALLAALSGLLTRLARLLSATALLSGLLSATALLSALAAVLTALALLVWLLLVRLLLVRVHD